MQKKTNFSLREVCSFCYGSLVLTGDCYENEPKRQWIM